MKGKNMELIKELLEENSRLKGANTSYKKNIISKTIQIRHFRVRLYKIRNSIDYLLKHPYSMDNSYNTLPTRKPRRNINVMPKVR